MKKLALIVAALSLLGAAVAGAAPKASPRRVLPATAQNQSNPQQQIQTFTGMITKTGDQFVFSDEATNSSYQLDDQKTASKFAGKKVKVTGTLDASNNTIRVQSIEAAA
jgi:uncharacterized protein YdeI (BOF family)